MRTCNFYRDQTKFNDFITVFISLFYILYTIVENKGIILTDLINKLIVNKIKVYSYKYKYVQMEIFVFIS